MTRIRCVALFAVAWVLGSCHATPAPATLLAEADELRLQYELHASRDALARYEAARKEFLGRDPEGAARAAQGIGHTHLQLGALSASLAAYREALDLARASPNALLRIELEADVGFARALLGDSPAELDDAQRACEAASDEADRRAAARQRAKALACLGEVLYTRGTDFDAALAVQRQAESTWSDLGDLRGVAQARLSQAWLYSDLRRFPEAAAALEGARQAWQDAGDRRGIAITLVTQARLLERTGEFQQALPVFESARARLGQMGDAVWLGASLTGLGLIHRHLGDLILAERHWDLALSEFEKAGLTVSAIDVLLSLGPTLLAQGDDTRALARFEEAHHMAGTLGNPRLEAWALRGIASVHLFRGAGDRARENLERASVLLEGLDEPRLLAQVFADLGQAYSLQQRLDVAREYHERALAVSQAARDYPGAAQALHALGVLEAGRGRQDPARAHLERALAERRRLFGAQHPLVLQSTVALARLDFAAGRTRSALSLALDVERASLDYLRLLIRYLPERQALNFAARRPRGLDLAVSGALTGTPAQRASTFDLIVRSRAVILDELAARRRVAAGRNDQVVERAARLRQRLANLMIRSVETNASSAALEEAKLEVEAVEREMAASSADSRRAATDSPGLEAVRRALPPRSVLVSFVGFSREHRKGQDGTPGSTTTSLAAFIMDADEGVVSIVDLGRADRIESLVQEWRRAIPDRRVSSDGSPLPDGGGWAPGDRLRRAVWDPVMREVNGADRILVVPDGALSLIPLAALPLGTDAFVIEQSPPIHYLSAERDVVSLSEGRRVSDGMLALGGPAFDDTPGSDRSRGPEAAAVSSDAGLRSVGFCGSLQNLTFAPLEGTLQEVQELARVWPNPGSVATLVGSGASESAFKQGAADYRVLHLATHGFFLDGACLPQSPAAPQTRGVGGLAATAPVQNPLRLSGLALAGANRRAQAKPDEDDGILTAEEVAMLDLQGVEWAVLSACDTGVGEIKAGEGVFGLRRAFQVAGARTVIMSLWSVEDQATRAWMRALYEGRFQRKLSTADAVHQASLTVLRDRRARGLSTHPFFWAAFVAAGDWR